jgi:hypothetical protein
MYIDSDNAFLHHVVGFPTVQHLFSQHRLSCVRLWRDWKVAGPPAHHWNTYLGRILHRNVVPFGFDSTSSTNAGGRRFALLGFSHLLAVHL